MKLLQIELIKLNRLANYILLGLIVLIPTAGILITFHTMNTAPIQNRQSLLALFERGEAPIIGFMLAVFVIMNIGKEYSDNTLRRNIIDGMTRDRFFRSKLLILILSVVLTYCIIKIILVGRGWIAGQSDAIREYLTIPVIINTFVKLLSVAILSFFLIFLTRNIAISIVAYFVWNIVESIIIGFQKFSSGWDFDVANYLPLSSMDKVLGSGEVVGVQTIIIAVGYLLIMLAIPYILLLKRDIK